MNRRATRLPCLLTAAVCLALPCDAVSSASDVDEFKVKREAVFEFAQKPVVTRQGDRVEVRFETKAFCDVTVAIEEAENGAAENVPGTLNVKVPGTFSAAHFPRIVRHLASGVLGPNAPEPFQKNSKQQTIVWDGKNDKGEYIDNPEGHTVRVSLGLTAEFERSLGWSPERRIGDAPPIICPAEEGVYVYQGVGLDHLRLFDHDGKYLRTIYPFPRANLEKVNGLQWFDFPQQAGAKPLPVKGGSFQQTFLTSGDNADKNGMGGAAATAMAVQGGRIALVHERLNRLATDGTTGGRPLLGPVNTLLSYFAWGSNADSQNHPVGPTSAAFSPDGKWVYLTGYAWRWYWSYDILHGVIRIPFEGDGTAEVFAGTMKQDAIGTGPGQFNGAASVACDKAGRVYVADLVNDRVQVFSPDGKFLKAIATPRPAQVEIHPRTQDIYVFSWTIQTRGLRNAGTKVLPSLARFGPFDDPKRIGVWPLPFPEYSGNHHEWWGRPGLICRGAIDGATDPPTIWIAGGNLGHQNMPWDQYNVRVLREKDGKLEVIRDFGKEVVRATGRPKYPAFNYQMQRLAVNPKTGRLYLMEPDSGPANKAYNQLVEFDPETGKPRLVDLPFNCEDLAFDLDGFIYLRSTDVVMRYDPKTWVEKPWDYGQDLPSVTCGEGGRSAPAVSGLLMPSVSPVCFHQGGMAVSPNGNLAVSCAYRTREKPREGEDAIPHYTKEYKPTNYPGRVMSSSGACVHIWDDRGRILREDAVPGMPQIDGLGLDKDGFLYVMATPTRILDGKPYFNRCSETMMKLDPKKAKFISTWDRAAVALPKEMGPARPPEVTSSQFGTGWVNGALWMYGGVGFAGFNGPGCSCWHVRFALDYFARSFAPEMDQCRVAVLDSNGNLITRIGQYGNEDDPPSAGIGLFYGAFLATHTDRRLFIADAGNSRIVSVKLDYYANERVPFRDVKETK